MEIDRDLFKSIVIETMDYVRTHNDARSTPNSEILADVEYNLFHKRNITIN